MLSAGANAPRIAGMSGAERLWEARSSWRRLSKREISIEPAYLARFFFRKIFRDERA